MSDKLKVVLIANDNHRIPDWVAERLTAAGIEYVYHDCHTREDLEAYASDADVVWLASSRGGLVVEENMDVFKKAGVVIKGGSGTDNIEHEACTRRGIIVAHTPMVPTDSTSDHHLAMLFTAVRQTARQDRMVRRGLWSARSAPPLGTFTGADLGIVGFGRIGRAILKKVAGFDMNVRVYDPFVGAPDVEAAGAIKVDLPELLSKSRYVLLACPLTKETRGLIGESELRSMRSDAVLVNVARAGVVDESALVVALKEGWIQAAALDVVEKHPLEPDDPFLELENVVITPHMGGMSDDYPAEVFRGPVEVIIEVSKGHRPKWIVNKDVVPNWDLR